MDSTSRLDTPVVASAIAPGKIAGAMSPAALFDVQRAADDLCLVPGCARTMAKLGMLQLYRNQHADLTF